MSGAANSLVDAERRQRGFPLFDLTFLNVTSAGPEGAARSTKQRAVLQMPGDLKCLAESRLTQDETIAMAHWMRRHRHGKLVAVSQHNPRSAGVAIVYGPRSGLGGSRPDFGGGLDVCDS